MQHFERIGGKFLFNIYIPKSNNQKTEIDVLLICSKGLFVFESKNYGGWIFGNEAHQSWTQTFPRGRGASRKERFYNPIMQNASHIRHLKRLVGEDVPMQSIIVFSDRCTLKDVTVKSNDVSVVNLNDVSTTVTQICHRTEGSLLEQIEIDYIYNKLYPYAQASREIREQHKEEIRAKGRE